MRHWKLMLPLMVAVLSQAALGQSQSPTIFDQVVAPDSRILFVGDELTQQMFYTRAVATGLMALRPNANLKFFNGGWDEATTTSALTWIDDLLGLAKPDVVFICLGLNDAQPASAEGAEQFAANLQQLVERCKGFAGVRLIVVLGPPAVPTGLQKEVAPDSYNGRLLKFSQLAKQVAGATGSGYVNLFDDMSTVYLGQMEFGGDALSLNRRLPSEEGHMMLASIVLREIGVDAKALEKTGWSPMVPGRMRLVRQVLALKMTPPSLELAERSRDLYESMRTADEVFFKMWRISGKRKSAPSREALHGEWEAAWANVRVAAGGFKAK